MSLFSFQLFKVANFSPRRIEHARHKVLTITAFEIVAAFEINFKLDPASLQSLIFNQCWETFNLSGSC